MAILLYSGNIGIGQDVETVLRAAAQLDGEAGLKVLIAGGGKGLPAVRRMVSQLGLTGAEICPPVPLCQLAELLERGDIHLICQRPGTEGLLVPSKIYSTLAAGRPSVFIGPVDCEVGRIVLESRSGFVVAPGDVEMARDVLYRLLNSPPLREQMGRNGRSYYERHFGRDRSVSRIVDIVETAGNGHERRGRQARMKAEVPATGPTEAGLWRRRMRRIDVTFHRKWLMVAGVAVCAVIGATHIPRQMMPEELQVRMLDKIEHMAAYGMIALFLLMSFRKPPGFKAMAALLVAGGLLGAIDELTQPLVHRSAGGVDWAADLIGMALACALFLCLRFRRRERVPGPVVQS